MGWLSLAAGSHEVRDFGLPRALIHFSGMVGFDGSGAAVMDKLKKSLHYTVYSAFVQSKALRIIQVFCCFLMNLYNVLSTPIIVLHVQPDCENSTPLQ